MPQTLVLHCPLCGESLTVHSPTLCRAIDIHSTECRPNRSSTRHGFVIAEHPHTRSQRANEYYWEIVRLHAVLTQTDERKCVLTKRVAELTTGAAASAAAMEALRNENAALRAAEIAAKAATSTDAMEALKIENAALRAERDGLRSKAAAVAPLNDLVRALQRIATAPTRRRKLLAILHPDKLNDDQLRAQAKFIRDIVLG